MSAAKSWEELPDECWESIFRRLDHHRHLDPLSLVCKRFLSISNLLLSTLSFPSPGFYSPSLLPTLFLRFPCLRSITICFVPCNGLDRFVDDLSCSDLPLESLRFLHQEHFPGPAMSLLGSRMYKTLRSLSFSWSNSLSDADLFIIAESFPYLERLDINYNESSLPWTRNSELQRVTDDGIREISIKLQSLRAVDLSGNSFLSDRSMAYLSSNCPLLSEVTARDCCCIGSAGLSSFLSNAPTSGLLSSLELSHMHLPDSSLIQLYETNLNLRKLALTRCRGFSANSLCLLAQSCSSLRQLDLGSVEILTDDVVFHFSRYLHNLVFVNLRNCNRLTNETLFNLLRSCLLLEEIQMGKTLLGRGKTLSDLVVNSRIRILKLEFCFYLSDETITDIGCACPELELLNLSHCRQITGRGVKEIGMSCPNLRHLELSGCRNVGDLGMGVEFPKLEVLVAPQSGGGDKWLSIAWKSCENLDSLYLESCFGVTERGLQELVANHRRLRKLYLGKGRNLKLSGTALARLVFSRVNLKKIVLPLGFTVTEKQKEIFLKHGCLVVTE